MISFLQIQNKSKFFVFGYKKGLNADEDTGYQNT
jgi:hypothetical protein